MLIPPNYSGRSIYVQKSDPAWKVDDIVAQWEEIYKKHKVTSTEEALELSNEKKINFLRDWFEHPFNEYHESTHYKSLKKCADLIDESKKPKQFILRHLEMDEYENVDALGLTTTAGRRLAFQYGVDNILGLDVDVADLKKGKLLSKTVIETLRANGITIDMIKDVGEKIITMSEDLTEAEKKV